MNINNLAIEAEEAGQQVNLENVFEIAKQIDGQSSSSEDEEIIPDI